MLALTVFALGNAQANPDGSPPKDSSEGNQTTNAIEGTSSDAGPANLFGTSFSQRGIGLQINVGNHTNDCVKGSGESPYCRLYSLVVEIIGPHPPGGPCLPPQPCCDSGFHDGGAPAVDLQKGAVNVPLPGSGGYFAVCA